MRLLALVALLLAVLVAACAPTPYIRDPNCRGAYESCVRACEMGPPMPTFGHEGMPGFEQGCANACYSEARACERRARAREPGEGEE